MAVATIPGRQSWHAPGCARYGLAPVPVVAWAYIRAALAETDAAPTPGRLIPSSPSGSEPRLNEAAGITDVAKMRPDEAYDESSYEDSVR
jgi:hypothetical protein